MIVIGKFLKPFGIKGELKFFSYSGETGHVGAVSFFYIERVFLTHTSADGIITTDTQAKSTQHTKQKYTKYIVEKWNISSHSVRCKIQNIHTIEQAHMFVGCDVYVDKDKAVPLQNNEYYVTHLVGAKIYFKTQLIGVVKHIYTNVYTPLFEIEQNSVLKTQQEIKSKLNTKKIRSKKPKKGNPKAMVPFLSQFLSKPYQKENCLCINLLDDSILNWSYV